MVRRVLDLIETWLLVFSIVSVIKRRHCSIVEKWRETLKRNENHRHFFDLPPRPNVLVVVGYVLVAPSVEDYRGIIRSTGHLLSPSDAFLLT